MIATLRRELPRPFCVSVVLIQHLEFSLHLSVPPLGGTSCGGSGGMGGVHRFIFTSKLEGRRP
jgi:hypothetical protein